MSVLIKLAKVGMKHTVMKDMLFTDIVKKGTVLTIDHIGRFDVALRPEFPNVRYVMSIGSYEDALRKGILK